MASGGRSVTGLPDTAPRAISQHGITVTLPTGWDGVIFRRQPGRDEATLPVLHAGSFPLPTTRGDYGSGAVELMGPTDVLVTLLEFGSASVGTALFAGRTRPQGIAARDFSPNALQRPLPGQAGVQRFFTEQRRAFCLYIVLGSFLRAGFLLPAANQFIENLQIAASAS